MPFVFVHRLTGFSLRDPPSFAYPPTLFTERDLLLITIAFRNGDAHPLITHANTQHTTFGEWMTRRIIRDFATARQFVLIYATIQHAGVENPLRAYLAHAAPGGIIFDKLSLIHI